MIHKAERYKAFSDEPTNNGVYQISIKINPIHEHQMERSDTLMNPKRCWLAEL